jgi:hypothetical protein
MPNGRISKRSVDAFACPPGKDREFLWDISLSGLCAERFCVGGRLHIPDDEPRHQSLRLDRGHADAQACAPRDRVQGQDHPASSLRADQDDRSRDIFRFPLSWWAASLSETAEGHSLGAIVGPFAACLDELAGGDHRGMTDARAFMRRTQKPLSSLGNITRSTRPAKTAVVGLLFAAIDCPTRSS